MRVARYLKVCFATLGVVVAISAEGGCEALVGETIPDDVACTGDLPGICPDGYFCGSGGTCTACSSPDCTTVIVDAGHEAAPPPVDAHVVDSGHDAGHEAAMPVDAGHEAASTGAIGDSCTDNAGCGTGLTCIPVSDLNGITLTATSVCSKPCCENGDCGGEGFGCYPTTGGNLCVTSRALETCGTMCGTPCCAASDCASSGSSAQFCAIGTTAAGTAPSCQPFSGDTQCEGFPSCMGVSGDPCNADSDCESGVCASEGSGDECDESFDCECLAPVTCCNNNDCKMSGAGNTCQWLETSDATDQEVVFRGCQQPSGNTASGQHCTSTTDCSGSACEQFPGQTDKLCTEPCCQDTDCAAIGSNASGQWVCRPFVQSLGVGNLAILICQPPAG